LNAIGAPFTAAVAGSGTAADPWLVTLTGPSGQSIPAITGSGTNLTRGNSFLITGATTGVDEDFLLLTTTPPPTRLTLTKPDGSHMMVTRPAMGTHTQISRSSGTVADLFATNIQNYSITTGDGTDNVQVNDLAGSGVSQVRLDLSSLAGFQTVYNPVRDTN